VGMLAFFVLIWALTGGGYFWPVWPALGWGIGVAMHGWATFGRRPISEEEIQREMGRSRGPQP